MKNLFYLLFTLITVSCSPKSSAVKVEPLANKTLWRISGNDLQEASYLFGTMHITCQNEFPEKVNKAFSNADHLVMEVNLGDAAQMMQMMMLMQNSTPISEELTPEQFNKLDALYKEKLGISAKGMDKMGLMAFQSTVMTKLLPCKQPNAMELLFVQKAKEEGKTTGGFETFAEQMELLNSIINPQETYENLIDFEKTKVTFQQLDSSYKSENLVELQHLMFDKDQMTEEQLEVLLTNRNQNWLTQIPLLMQDKPTFFAVGAGHLVGKDGVIQLLRTKGYKVEPVY